MANKAISELPQALNVNNQDLFVLEQSGIAKKLTAETFITEQGIIDALAEALDGHGGIQSVTLASVSGRIRTYLITFTDQSTTTFQVLDGTTITSIQKTSSSRLIDVYTIYMSDGTTSFFQVRNGQDGSATWDQINSKAPIISETTASSAIATFADGADDIPMQSVLVDIEPVQDLSNGDPAPTNICPITGHTEVNVARARKNLIPNTLNQYAETTVYLGQSGIDYLFFLKAGTYTISSVFEGTSKVSYYYKEENGDQTTIHTNSVSGTGYSFTLATDGNYRFLMFRSAANGSLSVSQISNVQLETGSTKTAYEPYQGETVSVDWTTEAGTVYEGTIDVATGVLTVTHGYANLGDGAWSYISSGQTRFQTNLIASTVKIPSSQSSVADVICSMYPTASATNVYNGTQAVGINTDGKIWIHDTSYGSDVDAFETAMNGVQLVYELATPVTYQLSEQDLNTLFGNNTVWSDLGDVTVTYPADTKMYIQNLTQPTEDDMVANQAITSGQYFMIGNSLYLALANIASGAQITIGTNAQRVSLADALNAINS